jgi:F-box/leucine-rich repeat protein 10/11
MWCFAGAGTDLEQHVRSPTVVRQIDWIDLIWPGRRRLVGQYPQVQYYCLMSVEGSWTDFHVDFGGTSVWYHVHTGKKVFFVAPPTERNLTLYETWTTSPTQHTTFLGTLLDGAFRIDVDQGETLIIPCGWIHAVWTPVDSLVFGGNFLHGYDIDGILRCYEMEQYTKVQKKASRASTTVPCAYSASSVHRPLFSAVSVSVLRTAAMVCRWLLSTIPTSRKV